MSRNVKTLAQHIACYLASYNRCVEHSLGDWKAQHAALLEELESYLPSGSGFDNGTKIDTNCKAPDTCFVLTTSFHHMDENGFYDGWTDHIVKIRATFDGFDISVSGRNKNGIKEYIEEMMHSALSTKLSVTFNHDTEEYTVYDPSWEILNREYAARSGYDCLSAGA